jgi:hypothetical protein
MLIERKSRAREEFMEMPFEVRAEDVLEDGRIKGYGSLFDKMPDSYGDLVAKGAFKKTIAKGGRNGTGIPILWQHDTKNPLGLWDVIQEDAKGLYMEGTLDLDIPEGKRAHSGLKKKYIRGLSIGFNTIGYTIDEKKKLRTLTEVDLWETSIVTFPAKTSAQVAVVKALEQATTKIEVEDILRNAGLSRTEAKFIVSRMRFDGLREAGRERNEEAMHSLLQGLKQINTELGLK